MKSKTIINNSKDIKLKEVYTDALGNKWYAHLNILELEPSRGVAAARAERFVGLKISESNMEALLDKAIDGVNKNQDLVQAIAILSELKYRTQFLCEENSLLDLAGVYYFLEDEDPRFPSEHHNTIKREIWAKDEVCRGFFLHMGLSLTKHFSTTVEEDLLKFMRETAEVAERIYQYIPRT